MSRCLICDKSIEPFMSFGQMPIANGFLLPEEFSNEYFFELKVGFCPNCTMVQLTELVDREKMFHENYAYFSSISVRMAEHFKAFATAVKSCFVSSDPFVVEIGSNDGIMLQHFASDNIRHLGVEPSTNVAQAAIDKGINTICNFFDEEVALRIREEYGLADVILGANVMCHIPYLHLIAKGVDKLLSPDGSLIFEDPYLGDIIEKTSYDQIYDEHAFYFSVSSISYLFQQHNMEVVDIEPQDTHGGSMRYTIKRKGAGGTSEAVLKQMNWEKSIGLNKVETFNQLRKNIERSRSDLVGLLKSLKDQGKRVVGYGATSKSTTVLNYCDIGPDLIDFISDTTPNKQGKFTPGMHIPVKPYKTFVEKYPDYALLFAWNHGKEIIAKEQEFMKKRGKFIGYVPSVKVLD